VHTRGVRNPSLRISLAILLVYAPFMGTRLISMTGDERVYVSQAVEMTEKGQWFLQLLLGVPDYYKGPLHLALVQLGYRLLGWTPWAILWMNLLAVIAGAYALGAIVRNRLPHWKNGDLWTGIAFATAIGIHSHALASQMEAELAGVMAISLYLLDRLKNNEAGYGFWILAGMAGWLKSPLHSALIGVTGIGYLALMGELSTRLKRRSSWIALVLGIGTCIAGYLPIILMDWEVFHRSYLLRETFHKGGNGVPWFVPWLSLFVYGLFPWTWIAMLSYSQIAAQLRRLWDKENTRRILSLALAGTLPSAVFFSIFRYRLENYTYPAIGAALLLPALAWSQTPQAKSAWAKAWRAALAVSAGFMVLIPGAIAAFQWVLHPSTVWWPTWIGPFCMVLSIGIVVLMIRPEPARVAASAVGAAIALNLLFWAAGQRELVDLRQLITEVDSVPAASRPRISCFNSGRNIWSDCSLLSFWVGRKIEIVHNKRDYRAALLRGDYFLLKTREFGLESFKKLSQIALPGIEVEVRPWKRWLTQGRAPDGTPAWKAALTHRDLSLLESDNYILRASPPASPPAPAASFDSATDSPAEFLGF